MDGSCFCRFTRCWFFSPFRRFNRGILSGSCSQSSRTRLLKRLLSPPSLSLGFITLNFRFFSTISHTPFLALIHALGTCCSHISTLKPYAFVIVRRGLCTHLTLVISPFPFPFLSFPLLCLICPPTSVSLSAMSSCIIGVLYPWMLSSSSTTPGSVCCASQFTFFHIACATYS